jgi:hypothetical protein
MSAYNGGVWVGNMLLEMLTWAPESEDDSIPGFFRGIAFEPATVELIEAHLESCDVTCSSSRIFFRGDTEQEDWSLVIVDSPYSRSNITVFFAKYADGFWCREVSRGRALPDVAAESYTKVKRLSSQALELRDGGYLGVECAKEVVLTSNAFAEQKALWTRLLGPPSGSEQKRATWHIGEGPDVCLQDGKADAFSAVVLKVKSLTGASRFLKEHRLLGEATNDRINIDSPDLSGLDIWLVE